MNARLPCSILLGLLAAAALSSAQELRDDRYVLLAPTLANPVALAATPAALFAVTGTAESYRSSDGAAWVRIAPEQSAPSSLLTHAGEIFGLRDGQLLKLEAGAWSTVSACSGALKSQHGYLYNYQIVSGSLSLRRSVDGLVWETLPSFANFGGLVGNLYDLAADEHTIVVTGHSGRFLLKQGSGPWAVKSNGTGDRLYSALLKKGRLVLGGTLGSVSLSSDFDTFTTFPGIGSLRDLSTVGGIVLGCGGFNPSGGRIVYSNDFVQWRTLAGPTIGSVSHAATLGTTIYFLATLDGTGRILRSEHVAPTPALEADGATRRIRIPRVEAADYRLQSSEDLSIWTTPAEALREENAEEISWSLPASGGREFFRVLID